MYKLSVLAAEDFAAIFEYTLQDFCLHQADAYTEDLHKLFNTLSDSPFMGRECPEIADSIRRHDHQHHAVFYRSREKGIFVIRILHQKMEPMKHFFAF